MKKILFVLCIAVATGARAQFGSDVPENIGTLKIGAGYTRDFPGLSGYTVSGEFSRTITNRLEGTVGLKRIQLSGYPRTASVNEYTKATTLDMLLYFLPVQSGAHTIRVGAGYSFSFYKIRRSYPVITNNGTDKITTWNTQDQQGRISGAILAGEYQYSFTEMPLSLGIRLALYRAYDGITYAGPFAAWRL